MDSPPTHTQKDAILNNFLNKKQYTVVFFSLTKQLWPSVQTPVFANSQLFNFWANSMLIQLIKSKNPT